MKLNDCKVNVFVAVCADIKLLFSGSSVMVDMESFLKLFNPDGSAATTNLSPVRKRVGQTFIMYSITPLISRLSG